MPEIYEAVQERTDMKKIKVEHMKLSKEEQAVDDALVQGGYPSAPNKMVEEIVAALERRKKDAVLNIRINQSDLDCLKAKAKRLGFKYQTFIAEILHKVALK